MAVTEYTAQSEIPLDVAKHMIVTALQAFDPQLGKRAADILGNDDRLNIVEAVDARTGMMQCRPAGLGIDDLKKSEMYFDDYAERFGPDFTEQENKRDYAVIDYEYTYTKDSVLYLAHELGHAMADDIQKERGRSFRDFSPNQLEAQAYFVQSIVADAVSPGFNRDSASYGDAPSLRVADAFNRNSQRHSAYTAFEEASALPTEQRGAYVMDVLGGAVAQQEGHDHAGMSGPAGKLNR